VERDIETRIAERSRNSSSARSNPAALRRSSLPRRGSVRHSRDLHDGIGQTVAAMEFSLHSPGNEPGCPEQQGAEQLQHAEP
jgi:signal transduction histidine kinase